MQATGLDPNIAAEVDKWLDLVPGVPANNENLKTLLRYVKAKQVVHLGPDTQPSALVATCRKALAVTICTPPETVQTTGNTFSVAPTVGRKEFDLDEAGLHKAIVWAKYSLKRYREEGPCPDCCNNPGERPRKRIRAEKMPKCEECILKAAVLDL